MSFSKILEKFDRLGDNLMWHHLFKNWCYWSGICISCLQNLSCLSFKIIWFTHYQTQLTIYLSVPNADYWQFCCLQKVKFNFLKMKWMDQELRIIMFFISIIFCRFLYQSKSAGRSCTRVRHSRNKWWLRAATVLAKLWKNHSLSWKSWNCWIVMI